jgi:hypothetical protein
MDHYGGGGIVRPTTEFSIELTSQELLTPPDPNGLVEVDDICDIEVIDAQRPGANTAPARDEYDCIEIELTPEEMDDLLSER